MKALYLKRNHRASLWLTHDTLSRLHSQVHKHLSTEYKKVSYGVSSRNSVQHDEGVFSLLEANRLRRELDERGYWLIYNC